MQRHVDRHVGTGTACTDMSTTCYSPESNHQGRNTKQPSKQSDSGRAETSTGRVRAWGQMFKEAPLFAADSRYSPSTRMSDSLNFVP